MGGKSKILIDNATPEDCVSILLSIRKDRPVTKEELEERAKERGVVADTSLFRSVNRLIDLGILAESKKNTVLLTDLGVLTKDLLIENQDLFYEFMHHLHMVSAFDDSKKFYFKTYYLIVEFLWKNGRKTSNETVISSILPEIETYLSSPTRPSIDATSVGKVIAWLRVLKPSFMNDKGEAFIPREDVRMEIILLAISAYYEMTGVQFGTPFMLDKDSLQRISLMGLIDVTFLSKNIPLISARFPILSLIDTVDGRSLLLRRKYSIGDLV